MPRRFAPRNDMQKVGRCARVQERTAGVLLETPLQSHSRRMFLHVIAQTSLQPLTRHRLLHVIANQCRGPRKGAPFVGRGATRERCPALAFGRSWAWRTLGRRGVAIRFPAEKLCQSVILKANSYPLFRIRPKYCFSVCAAARRTDCPVASLLAMAYKNPVRLIPGRCRGTAPFPYRANSSASPERRISICSPTADRFSFASSIFWRWRWA